MSFLYFDTQWAAEDLHLVGKSSRGVMDAE